MTDRSAARLWATILLALLATYLATVLLLGTSIAGHAIRLRQLAPLLVGVYLVLFFGLGVLDRRGRVGHAGFSNATAAAASILVSLLAMDVIYSVYRNATTPVVPDVSLTYERGSDPHPWYGELYPRSYYPTTSNFRVYKPDVSVQAETYGEFYRLPMLASPTLTDSVLEWRRIDYTIDAYGFRETTPRDSARIFILGDSFVFGHAIADGVAWVDRLEAGLGQPVYNLGVSSTGPRHQVDLLRYLLEGDLVLDHLVWLLYEGNDLENTHADRRDLPPTGGRAGLLQGTVLGMLSQLPRTVRDQSVLHRLLSGQLVFRPPGSPTQLRDHYQADGVALEFPLYHSDRWGYRLFSPEDIDRAARPAAYVTDHPNRPRIERLFDAVRDLSMERGFEVTVVLVPSAARLYGAEFGVTPAPTATPHFLDFVRRQAEREGFEVVDLLAVLADSGRQELLYFRDDHHWNARGNAVVANYLTTWFRERTGRTASQP